MMLLLRDRVVELFRLEGTSGGHLVQPSGQSKVRAVFRPACSGLCPVRSATFKNK